MYGTEFTLESAMTVTIVTIVSFCHLVLLVLAILPKVILKRPKNRYTWWMSMTEQSCFRLGRLLCRVRSRRVNFNECLLSILLFRPGSGHKAIPFMGIIKYVQVMITWYVIKFPRKNKSIWCFYINNWQHWLKMYLPCVFMHHNSDTFEFFIYN